MPVIVEPYNRGTAITLFIAARLLVAVAFVAIAFSTWIRPTDALRQRLLFSASFAFAVSVITLAAFEPRLNTLLFIPGQGLTPLKVALDYAIVLLNLAAAAGFARHLRERQSYPVVQLLVASLLMAVSEFCFTLYSTTADQYINFAHVLKIAAYLIVWKALFVKAVLGPYRELEAAQGALKAGEERYRLLFERNRDAVLVLDEENRVKDANPAALTMFRRPQGEVIGAAIGALMDIGQTALARLRDARDVEGMAQGEVSFTRDDGSRLDIVATSVAYRDSAGRMIRSWFAHDVTERNRQRDEIVQLNASLELRVAQRTAELAALNQDLEAFSYTVAHDLRAPLAAIGGFSDLLEAQAGTRLAEREHHYLDRIRVATAQMTGMIEALLDLARLSRSTLQPEPVDLAAAAQEVLEHLRAGAPERSVDLRVQQPMHALGDTRLLRIALQNLIGNAWKFTSSREDARIEVGSEAGVDGQAVYFVRDNGAGFDMAYAKRLFSPFQRMHSQHEFPGHGIGLANVSRIVRMHGGRLWAEARPDEGATFRFTLG
jgi:PAS domain S-box-containing protein